MGTLSVVSAVLPPQVTLPTYCVPCAVLVSQNTGSKPSGHKQYAPAGNVTRRLPNLDCVSRFLPVVLSR